jgi:hypothetical protein
MKVPFLIIHPKDPTTAFLTPIHKKLKHKTILTGGIEQDSLFNLMENENRMIIMGHGSGEGLFSVNRFPCETLYVIGEESADLLKAKKNNVFIWCYAVEYARQHRIPAFCTGMFISEKREAIQQGLTEATEDMIEASNQCFAEELSKVINKSIQAIYHHIMNCAYANLAESNPVAKYNLERIELV